MEEKCLHLELNLAHFPFCQHSFILLFLHALFSSEHSFYCFWRLSITRSLTSLIFFKSVTQLHFSICIVIFDPLVYFYSFMKWAFILLFLGFVFNFVIFFLSVTSSNFILHYYSFIFWFLVFSSSENYFLMLFGFVFYLCDLLSVCYTT